MAHFFLLIRATLRIRVSNRFLPEGNLRYDPHAHIESSALAFATISDVAMEIYCKLQTFLHFIRLNCFVGKHPQIQLTYKYLFHIKISFYCLFFPHAFFVEPRRGLSTCPPANDDHKSTHFTRLKYRLGLQWKFSFSYKRPQTDRWLNWTE